MVYAGHNRPEDRRNCPGEPAPFHTEEQNIRNQIQQRVNDKILPCCFHVRELELVRIQDLDHCEVKNSKKQYPERRELFLCYNERALLRIRFLAFRFSGSSDPRPQKQDDEQILRQEEREPVHGCIRQPVADHILMHEVQGKRKLDSPKQHRARIQPFGCLQAPALHQLENDNLKKYGCRQIQRKGAQRDRDKVPARIYRHRKQVKTDPAQRHRRVGDGFRAVCFVRTVERNIVLSIDHNDLTVAAALVERKVGPAVHSALVIRDKTDLFDPDILRKRKCNRGVVGLRSQSAAGTRKSAQVFIILAVNLFQRNRDLRIADNLSRAAHSLQRRQRDGSKE